MRQSAGVIQNVAQSAEVGAEIVAVVLDASGVDQGVERGAVKFKVLVGYISLEEEIAAGRRCLGPRNVWRKKKENGQNDKARGAFHAGKKRLGMP